MRISRKPGDLMEVDWAGNTLTIYDSVTGDAVNVNIKCTKNANIFCTTFQSK